MKMFHGLRFYATTSRDVSTFGGRAKQATIKIYRACSANSPACILDRHAQMAEFVGLIEDCGDDRAKRDAVMAEFVKFGG
jgi:hypothetical protein